MADITLSTEQLTAVALSTIRSVIGSNRYQYLSGPITGGRLLLQWHATKGRQLPEAERSAARRAAVTKVNIEAVKAEATRQRANGTDTIEPGSFEADFKEWGQPEFYGFWDRVIGEHASAVTFMEGWEFSAGCTFEYLRARIHGRITKFVNGKHLDDSAALRLLDDALREIAGAHDSKDPRDFTIAKLHTDIARYRDEILQLA